jgi:hypothetical protein
MCPSALSFWRRPPSSGFALAAAPAQSCSRRSIRRRRALLLRQAAASDPRYPGARRSEAAIQRPARTARRFQRIRRKPPVPALRRVVRMDPTPPRRTAWCHHADRASSSALSQWSARPFELPWSPSGWTVRLSLACWLDWAPQLGRRHWQRGSWRGSPPSPHPPRWSASSPHGALQIPAPVPNVQRPSSKFSLPAPPRESLRSAPDISCSKMKCVTK